MNLITSEWYRVEDCMPPRGALVVVASQYLPSDKNLYNKRTWDKYQECWEEAERNCLLEDCICEARANRGSNSIFNFYTEWYFNRWTLPKSLSKTRGLIKVLYWSNINFAKLTSWDKELKNERS